ncbi:hypothetical protein QBC34DRAFT_386846 [Podospora aff. communis PSN243]|uniref:DNA 3'-5' helicase n=1 Tax=Podospora aff. communis PSN243 TaxID=3040156 RepID=A0AAV9G634_9PEZI|nr:hypothetical protein QBC34DRAFT_386846 [Podospora aff. communis PSN243]
MAAPMQHADLRYRHARPVPSSSHVSLADVASGSARYDGLDEFDRDILDGVPAPPIARSLDEYDLPPSQPLPHEYHPRHMSDERSLSQAELFSGNPYGDDELEEAHVPAGRVPTHRLRDLHTTRQLETPSMHSASYGRTPLPQHRPGAGYTAPASSSPTTRLAMRRQSGFIEDIESSPTSATLTHPPERARSSHAGTPTVQGIPLVSLRQALPDKLRVIFPFELFNAVQSKCFDVIYNTGDNVVVSAPTGSGKTALLELAICRLALDRGNENFKIVYQAPTKALCSEKARDWENKFSHMSLKCAELTGDTSQAEMRRVGDASIIVTTPEKWDSITRKWHDHRRLLQMVELFLIDEVHILKDMRGATLEAVVSRMKTIGANVRFIALSATVPNSEDIAQWLGRNHTNQHLPAHRETFGEDFRPVKLEKFVYGYPFSGNEYMFDKFLDGKIPGLLARHTHKKPILIFCFTRKSCESTASVLAEYVSGRPQVAELWPMPTKRIAVINRDLQDMVRFGVAFHHAGLDVQDRNAVEQSFLKGQLSVICCTSTLAVGVNLPCHTAVLKGTVRFVDDNVPKELSDLEVMQMLGRAGRPQFDDSATAIILTRFHNKEQYERMVSGQEVLESTLHLHLIEHLNSEVCLGTVTDMQSAKTWLGGTFLSVRLRRNPKHYNMTEGISNASQIDEKLEEICERDVRLLQETELLTDGQSFRSTDYGRAMSKYMVEFTTMKNLLQIPRGVGMEALLTAVCQASEFREFRFKPAERAVFREVNQSQLIMYPVKEVVNQTWHKIFLMVQAELGSVQYAESGEAGKLRRQLVMEKKMVFEKLQRLVRAVIDCKGHEHDAVGVKNGLELARALSAESWEGRATQLTQVPNIGPAGMRKLASKGVRSVLELADKEPDEIERLMSRNPPFGRKIKDELEKFPRLALDVVVSGHKQQPRLKEAPVMINVGATIRYLNRKSTPHWLGKPPMLTFFAALDDGTLAFFWRESMRKVDKHNGLEVKFSVGLRKPNDRLTCHLSCEEIVGTEVSKVLDHGISASAFPRGNRELAAKEAEYMDDGLEDTDLIKAAEQAISSLSKGPETQEAADDDDYPSVEDVVVVSTRRETESLEPVRRRPATQDFDDLLAAQHTSEDKTHAPSKKAHTPSEKAHTPEWPEPVQLPNGRWRCNHACSGGVCAKSGKLCSHRCCKEGLGKPRKRSQPKPKRKEDEFEADTAEEHPVSTITSTAKPVHLGPPSKRQKTLSQFTNATEKNINAPKTIANTSEKAAAGTERYFWEPMDLSLLLDDDVVDLSQINDGLGKPKPIIPIAPMDLDDGGLDEFLLPTSQKLVVPQADKLHAQQSRKDQPSQAREHTQKIPNVAGITASGQLLGAGGYGMISTRADEPRVPGFRSGAKDKVFYQDGKSTNHDGESAPGSSRANPEYIPSDFSDIGSMFDEEVLFEDAVSEPPKAVDPGTTLDSDMETDNPTASPTAESIDVHVPKHNLREGEPDWVAEFDPEFVDLFRGYVTFV